MHRRLIYTLVFGAFLQTIFTFGFLLNYDNAWIHPENIKNLRQTACRNGYSFALADLLQAFNWKTYELGVPRVTRPLSNILELFNSKIRLYLWKFIVPHPSLSIVWMCFLFSPILFFLMMKNTGFNSGLGLAGTMLYHSSIGFLGPLIMMFHPAKSLANLALVFSFWLASFIRRKKILAKNLESWVLFLTASVYISFFWDETAVFIYPYLMLFFFGEIISSGKKSATLFLMLPLFYLGTIKGLIPLMYSIAGGGLPNVSNYQAMPGLVDLLLPNAQNWFQNTYHLFKDHLFWDVVFRVDNGLAIAIASLGCIAAMSAIILPIVRWRTLVGDSKGRIICSAIALFFYTYLQTFQLSHNETGPFWGAWWYGSYFSFFFALFLIESFSLIRKESHLLVGVIALVTMNLWFSAVRNHAFQVENLNVPSELVVEKKIVPSEIFSGKYNEFREFSFIESLDRSKLNYRNTHESWLMGYYEPSVGRGFLKPNPDRLFYLTQDLAFLAPPDVSPACNDKGI